MSGAARIDEAALIRRLQERSPSRDAAFAELFDAYRTRVFAVCRNLTRSRADAEDATQEVFVALMRALPGFRGESALGTFVHRIAVRIAIKHRLRSVRHSELRVETPEHPLVESLEAREEQRRLSDAVEQLSLEHRTVLALFAVEDLSHREIADILGIPEGTVWSRLHLARKRLAALLA
ncbi:MAG TPA: sigma-70 family RNA polymerase sigma factor [Polyangia bacterium]|nr:sigma-70 family RNA polymerase sigma factor [Polyangia bacterium]